MKKKIVLGKVSDSGKQKRLTIPNQEETKDWKQGDLIKLVKIQIDLKGG